MGCGASSEKEEKQGGTSEKQGETSGDHDHGAFTGGLFSGRTDAKGGTSRSPAAVPLAEAKPCRVSIWKQDPSVTHVGIREVTLPSYPRGRGPCDPELRVVTENTLKSGKIERDLKLTSHEELPQPDEQGNLLLDFETNPIHFSVAHTYAVARVTVDMFHTDLSVCGRPDWRWGWDMGEGGDANMPKLDAEGNIVPKTPLKILCFESDQGVNASYNRSKRAIKFGYQQLPGQDQPTYACRSMEVVAHEVGHAVLDTLKPRAYADYEGERGALHEAFADLTAMFSCLNQPDLCEDLCRDTDNEIRRGNFVTQCGEEIAKATYAAKVHTGIVIPPKRRTEDSDDEGDATEPWQERGPGRNFNNDTKVTEVGGSAGGQEMYDLSVVFTSYIWDVIVGIYELQRAQPSNTPADSLYRAARLVRRILLVAMANTGEAPTFLEISGEMQKLCSKLDELQVSDMHDYSEYAQLLADGAKERCFGEDPMTDPDAIKAKQEHLAELEKQKERHEKWAKNNLPDWVKKKQQQEEGEDQQDKCIINSVKDSAFSVTEALSSAVGLSDNAAEA